MAVLPGPNQTAYPILDGTDYSTFLAGNILQADIDPNFTPITWERAVCERIVRRWMTAQGQMDDPDYGFPIQRFVAAALLRDEVAFVESALRAEALKVEGTDDVTVSVVFQNRTLTVTATALLSNGLDVEFVFALTEAGAVTLAFPN